MKNLTFILLLLGFTHTVNGGTILKISPTIQLSELSPGFYIHESFTSNEYGGFTSNGLLLITNGKALMIDTPMTGDETKTIFQYLKDSMNVKLTLFIGGHYHDDCIGGMAYLKEQGIKTILGKKTGEKCRELVLTLPDNTFEKEYTFTFEGIQVKCFYPGAGHTADNIVVYFPDQQILFGGCLVKSVESTNLGNLADAVPTSWDASIEMILKHFPDVSIVVPGHGNSGSIALLHHTRQLVNDFLQKN